MDILKNLQLELFQGYDTFNGKGKNKVILGTPGPPGSGIVESYARVCTSLTDLRDALQIDASAAASYGAFSADAKGSYLHTLGLTANSVTVVVYARATTTTGPGGPCQLRDADIQTLKTADDIDDFVKKCGDSFVSEVTSGSEYIATYTFYSQTEDEQAQVKAALDIKSDFVSTNIGAAIAAKISNALKSVNVTYSINQIAFGISNVQYPTNDPETMIDFANSFSTLHADAPTTVSFKLEHYEDYLPHPVKLLFSPVKQNREAFVGIPGLEGSGWAGMQAQLEELNNECDALARFYRSCGGYTDPGFESRRIQAQADRRMLLTMLQDVDDNPLTIPPPPVLASLGYGTPAADYTVLPKDPLLSGGGGNPFQDVTTHDIPRLKHLTQVQMGSGDWVNRIYATYTAQQTEPCLVVHGGGGGVPSPILPLDDNEYISRMEANLNAKSGRWLVGWMRLTTSKGKTLVTNSAFVPPKDTNYQDWSAGPGELIIGFAGRSGDFLDAIQPLVLRLSPATWAPNELRSRALAAASR